jgi:hypothetical protein
MQGIGMSVSCRIPKEPWKLGHLKQGFKWWDYKFSTIHLEKTVEKCELDWGNDWNAAIRLETHRIKETRWPILITTKSENQKIILDLENETIKGRSL